MNFNPQNILIVHFGQIGDVILSLPALRAVRERFPAARITALIGKSGAEIVELSGFSDESIIVDRVRLRDGNKLISIRDVFKITRDVRRRRFDFVVDLHSLYETNILGFLSGAPHRLYANRENRSLDFLAKFNPAPPSEDKTEHLTDRYLSVLAPLGIEKAPAFVELPPNQSDLKAIERILRESNVGSEKLVGLFPGAGHPSRRWKLENFAACARLLEAEKDVRTIVFLGPEEKDLRPQIEEKFPPETLVVDNLSLREFAAALSRLTVLISNDTGAAHIGAIAGTHIILVMDKNAPTTYLPLTEKKTVVRSGALDAIEVEEVYAPTREVLSRHREFINEISSYTIQTI